MIVSEVQDIRSGNPVFIEHTEALDRIKNNYYKLFLDEYTKLRQKGLIEEAKKYKTTFPSIMFAGQFSGCCNDDFIQSSGIYHVDIDKIPLGELQKQKELICSIPFVLFCFISPSRNGLKVGIKIDPNKIQQPNDYEKYFPCIQDFFNQNGFKIDSSRKNIASHCFVSCDSDLYYNDNAELFELKERNSVKQTCINRITSLFQNVSNGERHTTRLKAGNLAGGYIAGGLIDEGDAALLLFDLSNSIADKGKTSKSELKTIEDAVEHGKLTPIKKIGNSIEEDLNEFNPETDAQEWNDITSDIDFIIPFDCVARDIQQWILKTSPKQQPAIAFCASISLLSCLIGRNINNGGIKGNFMSICIAPSAQGKDWPMKAIDMLLSHPKVGMSQNVIGKPASGAAVIDAIESTQLRTALFNIDECGHFLSGITGKGANQYSREIMPMLTELYTSGSTQYREKARQGNQGRLLIEPNVVFLGLTTERQVMDRLKSSDIADGSLARFFVVFGNDKVKRNKDRIRDYQPPEWLIDNIVAVRDKYKKDSFIVSTNLKFDTEYYQTQEDIADHFEELVESTDNDWSPTISRLFVKAVQLAMLIDGCKDIEVIKWCADLVEKCNDVFIKKFKHMVADNEHEMYVKAIEDIIKKSGKNGVSKNEILKKSRKVPAYIRNQLLKDYVEQKIIFVEKRKVEGSRKVSEFFYWSKY